MDTQVCVKLVEKPVGLPIYKLGRPIGGLMKVKRAVSHVTPNTLIGVQYGWYLVTVRPV